MGKEGNRDHLFLWLFSGTMILFSLLFYFTIRYRPITEISWYDCIYLLYVVLFCVIHLVIDIKSHKFGLNRIILYSSSISMLFVLNIAYVFIDLTNLSLQEGEGALLTPLEWMALLMLASLPVIFFSLLLFIFGTRDIRYERRRIFLPISRWKEWREGTSIEIHPEEIIEVYPRWMLKQKGTEGRFIRRPVFEASKRGGFGFKLKDGRRFGFEPTSCMIDEDWLRTSIGGERFDKVLVDHAKLTDEEWARIRKDVSKWYTSQDGMVAILVMIGIGVMFLQGFVLILFHEHMWFVGPFLALTIMAYFGPMIIIYLYHISKWFFIRGTIFRMKDTGSALPDWVEIKSYQITLKE